MQLALIVFHQFLSVLFTIMYLVRFLDFSKDFFLFLMKCTKIFRVIYPSMRIDINLNYHLSYQLCTILGISEISIFLVFCNFLQLGRKSAVLLRLLIQQFTLKDEYYIDLAKGFVMH